MDHSESTTRRWERRAEDVQDGLAVTLADVKWLEAKRLLPPEAKQSARSLRKHLEELSKDAADLRKSLRPKAEVSESVDSELAGRVTAKRNGGEPVEVEG